MSARFAGLLLIGLMAAMVLFMLLAGMIETMEKNGGLKAQLEEVWYGKH